MRRLGPLLLLGICAATPSVVRAQSLAVGAAPGAKLEGAGVSLGDSLVLHVGVGAELRYDSNVFYEPNATTQGLALRLTPGFLLSTKNGVRTNAADGAPTPHKVDFRFGGGLDYREWLVSSTGIRPPRQLNAIGNFLLTILPTGPVTVDIYDNYVRSSQPAYFASTTNFDRDMNEAGIRFRIKPGGGRLELQLGYAFGIDLWETAQEQQFNNFYHHAVIRLLYKFLPKTSVYIQGEEYAYQYRTPSPDRPDGYPLRVIAGLNGLLTAKLTFDIYGGYVNGFYQSATLPSASTGMAGLTLTWRPYSLASLSLGYHHDILNALLGVYADTDNVEASWSMQIWKLFAYLRLAYQNTRYQGITAAAQNEPSASSRTDNAFTLNARVDYYAYKGWLGLSLGYDLNLLRSDSVLGVPTGPTTPVDFTKHEAYLSVSLFY